MIMETEKDNFTKISTLLADAILADPYFDKDGLIFKIKTILQLHSQFIKNIDDKRKFDDEKKIKKFWYAKVKQLVGQETLKNFHAELAKL